MDASGARSEISLGIWVVGRTYPVASGLLTSCGSASMNSFVLSMLPYAAAFQTSSTGCSSGLPGSAAMTTTYRRNSLGRPDWVVWSIGGRVTRRRRERWRFTGGYRAITVRWVDETLAGRAFASLSTAERGKCVVLLGRAGDLLAPTAHQRPRFAFPSLSA